MATFPNIKPDYGASLSTEPKVCKAQFGDGYAQRVKDGMNNLPRKWNLTFTQTEANADTIESFLESTYGSSNFDWAPPRGASGKWVVSEKWDRSVQEAYDVITVVFEEDFGV